MGIPIGLSIDFPQIHIDHYITISIVFIMIVDKYIFRNLGIYLGIYFHMWESCGNPMGILWESCGNGMGMAMKIPFPRQPCQDYT